MNKRKSLILFFLLVFVLMISTNYTYAYESLQGPTELRFWDKTKAYNGYTLFAAHGRSILIDMEGSVINTWKIGTNPKWLGNGDILDAATDDPSGFAGFKEVDWQGNTVWEYRETRKGYSPHHDFIRIFNKKLNDYTLLYIANREITTEQALAAGCDPKKAPYDGASLDTVVEVDKKGTVIWEWWFFDHGIQDIDPTKANYVGKGNTIADYPGRINLNMPGKPLRRDWLHCNSIDYNEALDQIMVNSVHGEFYIIDHGKTFLPGDPKGSVALAAGPDGDFIYRFGDPARYNQGDPPSILEDWTGSTTGTKQIGGSHDAHWIRPGLPGAGNILVFNNGQYLFERTPQSYVFEINPFFDASKKNTGHYVNPPEAGYYRWDVENRDTHKQPKKISNQVVWIYGTKSNQSFFSHIGSSSQRLPNGNTLVCSDTSGHFFEMTASGELAWEYISPVTKEFGIVETLPDCYPMTNSVFRAYRIAPDDPGLKGRNLKSQGKITTLKESLTPPKNPPAKGNNPSPNGPPKEKP